MGNYLRRLRERAAFRYFLISCFVTVADTAIVVVAFYGLGLKIVFANTVGVVTGYLLHYLLTQRLVFQKVSGWLWALSYTLVFLLGLLLADWIIWFVYEKLGILLLGAKLASIVIPYFFMYFLRRYVYKKMQSID